MEEYEERLMSLSDSEKINMLESDNRYSYYIEKILVMSLQSDELKLQMIDRLFDSDKAKLVESLKSDQLKLDYLRKIKDGHEKKGDIAKSIKSDELKIQALSLFEDNDEYTKQKIIITMQSDENKLKAMKQHIKAPYYFSEILESLTLDENKIVNLNLLSSLHDKRKVLESITIENDEQRLSIVAVVEDDYLAFQFIEEIEDEKKKKEAIDLLSSDSYKAEVIKTLQNDTSKIEQLEKLSDDRYKAEVIKTLQDDTSKIEQLEKLSDDRYKAEVIKTLQDDTSKIEQLEKLSDEYAKAAIISTLQNDTSKIEQLEKLSDVFVKAIIIELNQVDNPFINSSLTDREKLIEFLLDSNRTYTEIGLDKNMTIGMEIESEGIMSQQIEKLKKIVKKQINGEKRGWETKGDGSLYEGVEVVSPILTDNREDIEDIYMVCAMMQKCGQEITERCGGHIHIGADYLKSKEAYVNLFEIWGNAEKIICEISNEKGTIPRIGLQEYAAPISSKLNAALESETVNLESEEDLEQFISEIQDVQGDRYSGLNLLNINNGKNTIEFRIPNGTINADTWIENARLFGRIVQISQKLAEIEKQSELSEEDRKLLDLKNLLKEEIPEQEKMEILLELLFSEEERTVYRERYISSSKLLEHVPDEKNPFQETKFSKVDFKKKKHTLGEFHEVAVNDRTEATNDVTRETLQGVKTEQLEQSNNKNMEEK